MEEFDLSDNEYILLWDLLKKTGLCSTGGMAKAFISDGLVNVDGKVELRKRCKIRLDQIVTFEGQQIKIV